MQSPAGMSRAAKKRRRKSETIEKLQESIDGPDALQHTAQHPLKPKNLVSVDVNDDDLIDFSQFSVSQILSLRDVSDIEYGRRAESVLQAIIQPTRIGTFYSKVRELQILHSSRGKENHFQGLFTRKSFENILANHINFYYTDVDVSICSDGNEQSANILGLQTKGGNEDDSASVDHVEVKNRDLWQRFAEGYTLCLKCPQKSNNKIWQLLSVLEHEFETSIGCHAHLSPPQSQGFGMHENSYDAFMLQLEGSSAWRIAGKDQSTPLDISLELKTGDSLYIPKNWQFSMINSSDEHSLHLELFINEGSGISDIMQLIVPQALQLSIDTVASHQRSLPRHCMSFMGVAASENDEDYRRDSFAAQIRLVMADIANKAVDMLDAASDQLGKAFIAARLPVPLTKREEARSAAGLPAAQIMPYTRVRMVRPGIARALVEEGMVVLYHCMDNARERFGSPLQPLEFELDDGPTIEALLHAYPGGVLVSELPHVSEELDDKVGVAQALFKEGILLIEDEVSADSATGGRSAQKRPKEIIDRNSIGSGTGITSTNSRASGSGSDSGSSMGRIVGDKADNESRKRGIEARDDDDDDDNDDDDADDSGAGNDDDDDDDPF